MLSWSRFDNERLDIYVKKRPCWHRLADTNSSDAEL